MFVMAVSTCASQINAPSFSNNSVVIFFPESTQNLPVLSFVHALTDAGTPFSGVAVFTLASINQSINQSFICIRPMVHIKEEKIDNKNRDNKKEEIKVIKVIALNTA